MKWTTEIGAERVAEMAVLPTITIAKKGPKTVEFGFVWLLWGLFIKIKGGQQ